MKTKLHTLLSLLALPLALASCLSKADTDHTPGVYTPVAAVSEEPYDAGHNPYSLSVMAQAMERLRAEGYDTPDILEANTLYVTLHPADSASARALCESDLVLSEEPLCGEQAPTAGDCPVTFFASVPAGYTPPAGVTMNIIDRCYLPEPDTRNGLPSGLLEREAVLLAGGTPSLPATRGQDPVLCGRLSFTDTQHNIYTPSGSTYPVAGVTVRCSYFLRTAECTTDEKGRWSVENRFPSAPNVHVVMKSTDGYTIWNGLNVFVPATALVYRQFESGLDIRLDESHRAWQWAAVNRGARDWYAYCRENGIALPPDGLKVMVFSTDESESNAFGSAPMLSHIGYVKASTKSDFWQFLANLALVPSTAVPLFLFGWATPDIILNGCRAGGNASAHESACSQVYYRTLHEFAHSSHFARAGKELWRPLVGQYIGAGFTYCKSTDDGAGLVDLTESWALASSNYIFSQQNPRFYGSHSSRQFRDGKEFRQGALLALLNNGTLTHRELFLCLDTDVQSMETLLDRLSEKYPEKREKITKAFAQE